MKAGKILPWTGAQSALFRLVFLVGFLALGLGCLARREFVYTGSGTENEGEPVMAEEEFELGSVFKVAGVIALVVFLLGIVGLLSNL